MELFDIDIEGDYPLIEVGRMSYVSALSGGGGSFHNFHKILTYSNIYNHSACCTIT